jgi:hypothetical protein
MPFHTARTYAIWLRRTNAPAVDRGDGIHRVSASLRLTKADTLRGPVFHEDLMNNAAAVAVRRGCSIGRRTGHRALHGSIPLEIEIATSINDRAQEATG